MGELTGQMVLADVQKSVGYTLAVILIIGFAVRREWHDERFRKLYLPSTR